MRERMHIRPSRSFSTNQDPERSSMERSTFQTPYQNQYQMQDDGHRLSSFPTHGGLSPQRRTEEGTSPEGYFSRVARLAKSTLAGLVGDLEQPLSLVDTETDVHRRDSAQVSFADAKMTPPPQQLGRSREASVGRRRSINVISHDADIFAPNKPTSAAPQWTHYDAMPHNTQQEHQQTAPPAMIINQFFMMGEPSVYSNNNHNRSAQWVPTLRAASLTPRIARPTLQLQAQKRSREEKLPSAYRLTAPPMAGSQREPSPVPVTSANTSLLGLSSTVPAAKPAGNSVKAAAPAPTGFGFSAPKPADTPAKAPAFAVSNNSFVKAGPPAVMPDDDGFAPHSDSDDEATNKKQKSEAPQPPSFTFASSSAKPAFGSSSAAPSNAFAFGPPKPAEVSASAAPAALPFGAPKPADNAVKAPAGFGFSAPKPADTPAKAPAFAASNNSFVKAGPPAVMPDDDGFAPHSDSDDEATNKKQKSEAPQPPSFTFASSSAKPAFGSSSAAPSSPFTFGASKPADASGVFSASPKTPGDSTGTAPGSAFGATTAFGASKPSDAPPTAFSFTNTGSTAFGGSGGAMPSAFTFGANKK